MKPRSRSLIGSPFLRWAGLACLLVITVVSLTPMSILVRTPLPGEVEHFFGYAAVAGIWTLAVRRTAFPWVVIGAMAALAGALEVLQFLSPSRSPELIGLVSSSLGAAVGALAAHRWRRMIVAREADTSIGR
jgi:VanZ family protein